MSRVPAIEMRRLEAIEHPPYDTVIEKAKEFLGRTGLGIPQLADLLSVGHSTLSIYLRGEYATHPGMQTTRYMDAKVWSYINRNWPRKAEPPSEDLLDTQGYRQISECIEEAVEVGAISLIYGPPSSEKSFVGEQIVARYREAGRRDLLRVVCNTRTTPLMLLRKIAREAEVWVHGSRRDLYVDAIVREFLSRERVPAIVVDEAQHLDVDGFETLRLDLHEATRRGGRKGCGLVVMGSHHLYSWLVHPARKMRLEQWFSRNSYRVQLAGMKEEEVLNLAARALGSGGKKAKFDDAQKEKLLRSCRVLDPFATDAAGNPLRDEKTGKPIARTYYSSRRLLEAIRQRKRKGLSLVMAEEVA
jgi:DNA transposition AAA+ family ATPase